MTEFNPLFYEEMLSKIRLEQTCSRQLLKISLDSLKNNLKNIFDLTHLGISSFESFHEKIEPIFKKSRIQMKNDYLRIEPKGIQAEKYPFLERNSILKRKKERIKEFDINEEDKTETNNFQIQFGNRIECRGPLEKKEKIFTKKVKNVLLFENQIKAKRLQRFLMLEDL